MAITREVLQPVLRPVLGGVFPDDNLPVLEFDFENTSPDGLTNAGANTNRWYDTAAGVLTQVATAAEIRDSHHIFDGIVWESVGLVRENALDHQLRNNTMVGANAGTDTPPTFWQVLPQGATVDIVDVNTIDGVEYIDIRLSGTPAASPSIRFESNTQIAALTGTNQTVGSYVGVVAGDDTNFNSITLNQSERDAGGGFIMDNPGPDISGSLTANLVRFTSSVVLSGGVTTAFVLPMIVLNWTAGAVDITLRIGVPTQEPNPYATTPVKTGGATVLRNADKITFDKDFRGNRPEGRWESNYRPKTDGTSQANVGYILNGIDGGLNAWAWRMQDTGADLQPRGVVGNGAVVAEVDAGIAQTPDVDNVAEFIFDADSAQMVLNGTAGTPSATGFDDDGSIVSYEIGAFADITMKRLAYFHE